MHTPHPCVRMHSLAPPAPRVPKTRHETNVHHPPAPAPRGALFARFSWFSWRTRFLLLTHDSAPADAQPNVTTCVYEMDARRHVYARAHVRAAVAGAEGHH